MNLTLIIVLIVMFYMVAKGYQKGFTKQISGLVALTAAFVMLALGIMLVSSFQNGEVTNTVYSVVLLAVFGLVLETPFWDACFPGFCLQIGQGK